MARAKIEIKGPAEIKVSDAVVTKINQEMFGFAVNEIERRQKNVVGRMVKAGHKGAHRAVEEKLAGGVTPLTGGIKNIAFSTGPQGYSGRVRTPAWAPLTRKYARSSPRSTAFWLKHPGTSYSRSGRNPRYTLLTLFRQADFNLSLRSSRPRKGRVSKNQRFLEVSWDWKAKFSDNVLGSMISASFFEAFEVSEIGDAFYYPRVSRDDVSFIVWLEQGTSRVPARPFVRRMSFAIGKKVRSAVQKRLREYQGRRR